MVSIGVFECVVVVKAVEVTCPNEHRLTYSKGVLLDFACDAARFINEGRVHSEFTLDDGAKTKYGLSETEEWHCLSGEFRYHAPGYDTMRQVMIPRARL